MRKIKVLLPSTIDLEPLGMAGVETVVYDVDDEIPLRHRDAEVLVVWGNPPARLREAARVLVDLRWVGTLAAGPETIVGAGFADRVILTSGVSLHSGPVAEHALALVLGAARRLHELRDAQRTRSWAAHLGGLQPRHAHGAFRSLIGAHVVIWGLGRIGRRLAGYLTSMEANVTGVARREGERDGVRVVAAEGVDCLLPTADALVMILPSTPSTHRALDARRLRLLPQHAWLINVGRGDTVDETALVEALRTGVIAGASLDVFATEPLRADSKLWALPNVVISPHAAGGRPMGAEALLRENMEAYIAGRQLRNVVARG